jgi:hypothetical protein
VTGWRGRAARYWPIAALVGAALLAGLLAGPPAGEGPPLDPASSDPSGTRALVELLGALEVDVEVTAEVPDRAAPPGRALLLTDRLDDDARDALLGWVGAGSTLVVADSGSPLVPEVAGGTGVGFLDVTIGRDCDLAALDDVGRISAPGSAVYEVPDGAVGCFPRGEGHWLVARAEGDGTVVALGGPTSLVNRELATADNSVLAAALLAPSGGDTVTLLRPALPGEGDATLGELVPPSVRLALVQLGIAFLVVVAWRARRLGRPVAERQPVQIAGAEIVTAVGNLLQQTRAREQAARLLTEDLRRTVADRLGLPAAASPEVVADTAAARTGVGRDEVLAALRGRPPADEAELVALAHGVEQIRDRILHPARGPEGDVRVH